MDYREKLPRRPPKKPEETVRTPARCLVSNSVYQKLKALEKKYRLSQSDVLRLAIIRLFERENMLDDVREDPTFITHQRGGWL